MKPLRQILWILYQPYKWLFYLPFFFINTLIFGIIAVLVATLVNQFWGSYWGGVVWSRLNASLVPMFVRVYGREHIQKNTSYIVLANHQSAFDIFLIYGWLGIDIKWVMKKELRKIPGLGFGAARVGHIFLDRSHSRAAVESLEEAKRKLVDGTSVVIFPEGTRSLDGRMKDFRRGAFKLALDLDRPILPVSIVGTRNILPHKTFNLFPGHVTMIIHPPISLQEMGETDMKSLMDTTRKIIEKELPDYTQ